MDVWTLWQPLYGVQAAVKAVTAAVSVVTAVALWPLIPKALRIPLVDEMQANIQALESEIAQRRAAEQSMREAEEALLVTLDSIEAGFIATDREGRVQRMNALAERLTQWPEEQARGRPLGEVLVREDASPSGAWGAHVGTMADAPRQGEAGRGVAIVGREGLRTELDLTTAPSRSADGSIRRLIVVFRDMTRLNQGRAAAHLLASIVESSHDAIYSKSLDGSITSWNRAAEDLYGYTAQEVIGRSGRMLMPPGRETEEILILGQMSAGLRIPAFETRRLRKDGSEVDVSIAVSPIRDEHGRVVGASKIVRDISLQKKAEALRLKGEQLEAQNREFERANRLKSEFLANMSHELRTPLNAIIGFADLLGRGTVPPQSPKHAQFLQHISTSGRHLLQLINDVLDLSKIEAGKLEFHPRPIALPDVVKEVVDILQEGARRGGVRLHQELDASLTDLLLDPSRLKQILYNYLSNAIKFTPQGGRVTVRALPEGDRMWRLEVEDTGVGIAADDLSKLFVEFQQIDGGMSRQHTGTGLGLALTRRLAHAQGGTVGVSSTPGVGSVFHVILPRDASHILEVDTSPPNLSKPATHRRLLIVEDDAANRHRLMRALSQAGVEADSATTAEQAVQRAAAVGYDGITLDVFLPDRPGLEVLHDIRSQAGDRHCPVLALTVGRDLVANFAVVDVLAKPINTEQILTGLGKLGLLNRPGARVMVVDDDPVARDLVYALLRGVNVQVDSFAGGHEALRQVDELVPDAIILDLMMPEMDGFAVLEALRRKPRSCKVPVFIWTSMYLSEEEYARLATSARAIVDKGRTDLGSVVEQLHHWRLISSESA
jgi:PAS domain S-box-containing protein